MARSALARLECLYSARAQLTVDSVGKEQSIRIAIIASSPEVERPKVRSRPRARIRCNKARTCNGAQESSESVIGYSFSVVTGTCKCGSEDISGGARATSVSAKVFPV